MARESGLFVRKSVAPAAASRVGWEDVAKLAYELYDRRGRQPGRELEDWLEAERIVRQRKRNGR